MKKYFKTTIIVVIILTLIVSGIARKALNKNPKSNFTTVRIEEAAPGELTEIVTAPGEVEPKTKVEISAKVSGRVVELPFEEGEEVTAGDPDANPPILPSDCCACLR